jgi:ribonuclease BN (tRNA processing enzyme)
MPSTTNENKFTITILGSGTCVPSLKRGSCSVLMEIGSRKLLFDSGPGTMRRLLEAGITIFDISSVFYSHLHPDHTSELVPFLFATKYPDQNLRKTALTIIAGKGFSNFFSGLEKVYGEWIRLETSMMELIELNNNSRDLMRFDNFTVHSIPVAHNEESLAFRIEDNRGKSVVYSGDTDFSENLIDISKDADLLICESSMPDNMKIPGHLTPSLAGEIAARSGVKKLLLTHFYPECDKVDIANECRRTYSGELILAEDLMKIKIGI